MLCNEPDPANASFLEGNLATAAASAAAAAADSWGAAVEVHDAVTARGGRLWRLEPRDSSAGGPSRQLELVHEEAGALLARCRLEGRFFDLIDSDSFGAACHLVGAALGAVRYGGCVCLTSTAGTRAGHGSAPAAALPWRCHTFGTAALHAALQHVVDQHLWPLTDGRTRRRLQARWRAGATPRAPLRCTASTLRPSPLPMSRACAA